MSQSNMKNNKYSHKQLCYLRLGLSLYKSTKNVEWTDIAEAIIHSPTNQFKFPELTEKEELQLDENYREDGKSEWHHKGDKGWPIQYQDLRRFVDGIKNRESGKTDKKNISFKKILSIHKFLESESYLPQGFDDIDEDNYFNVEASVIVNFFGNQEVINANRNAQELAGIYQFKENLINKKSTVTIVFTPCSEETYYLLEEEIIEYQPKTNTELCREFRHGLAFFPDFETFTSFLRNSDHQNTKISSKIYVFRSMETKGKEILTISADNLSNSFFVKTEGEEQIPDKNRKILEFRKYSPDSGLRSKENSNVVSLFGKKRKDVTSFSSGDDHENHPWEKYKRELEREALNQGREEKMSQGDLNTEFLAVVRGGEYWRVGEVLGKGAAINARLEGSQSHALHLASYYNAIPVIEELAKHDNLEYLVLDSKNRLPSYYAFVGYENPELGTFLQGKEMEEAVEKGLDYKELALSFET